MAWTDTEQVLLNQLAEAKVQLAAQSEEIRRLRELVRELIKDAAVIIDEILSRPEVKAVLEGGK